MRVVVTGATGLLGKALISQFAINGNSVVVPTRNVEKAKEIFPLHGEIWNVSSRIGNINQMNC